MGEEGDSYPVPLGPSICLAPEPWHLLTAIVRLCQMTGQDSHGGNLGQPARTVVRVLRTRVWVARVFVKAFEGQRKRPNAG